MAVPFKKREDIEAWLKTQPRDVVSVFAIRVALRTIPQYWPIVKVSGNTLIQALWAASAALSAVKWHERPVNLQVTIPEEPLDIANPSFIVAAYTADVTASSSDDIAAATATAFSADTAANSLHYPAAAIFSATYTWDKAFIEAGQSAHELINQALWTKMPNNISNQWFDLKTYLLSLDQDWDVWTDWYEDRLRGNQERPFTLPFIEEIEIGFDPENGQYGRVTFPPEDYKNPAKVNAQIKQLIEDYRARQELLKQDKTAETFGINADGKITRTTAETSSELTDTPEQRNWYNSLRQAALGMKDIGENALGRAARPVNNVLAALPEDITKAKVALLWPAANRIRKLKAAHERTIGSGEDYNPNSLAAEVVDDVNQFVEVYNNLVIGDSGLSEKDKDAKGPQEAEAEASEAANQTIEAAIEHGLVTEEAQIIIEDDIAEDREITAQDTPTVLERLAQDNIRRQKSNFVLTIIRRFRDSETYGDISKGAKMAIGGLLVAYVSKKLPELLNLVLRLFS